MTTTNPSPADLRIGTRFRKRRVRAKAAYTIVEVIIALSVLAVGGMGVIALQKFTVAGALNARGIATATTVANSWLGVAQNEASAWNSAQNTDTADMPVVNAALLSANNWVLIPTTADSPNAGATPLYGSTTGDMFF